MNELPIVKMQSSARVAPRPSKPIKKMSIVVLVAFIVLVMLVWIGFLGWGIVTAVGWIVDAFEYLLSALS